MDPPTLFAPMDFEFSPIVDDFHLQVQLRQFAKDFFVDLIYTVDHQPVASDLNYQFPVSVTTNQTFDYYFVDTVTIFCSANNRAVLNLSQNIEKFETQGLGLR